MFVIFQFPLVESRPFIPDPTNKLSTPVWPLVNAGEDYVRSFGIVKMRFGGGNSNWEGEEVFSNASRAMGFQPFLQKQALGSSKCQFAPICYFRRFFSDGKAVSRVEIGFNLSGLNPVRHITDDDIHQLLVDLMNIQVTIPKRDKKKITCNFYDAGRYLAKHYLESTTKIIDKKVQKTKNWWVSSGMPLIFLEPDQDVQIESLHGSRKIDFSTLKQGIKLSYIPFTEKGKPIALWVLEKSSQHRGDKDYLRRLRLHILRLHTERECLKRILRNIISKKIKILRGDQATEKLQGYLINAAKLLRKQNRNGIPQSEILKKAMNIHEIVNEGEITTLLSQLSSVRKNVKDIIDRYVNENRKEKTVFISYNHKDIPFVKKFKEELERQNINVRIDIDKMKFRDNIQSFIEESVRESYFTIFVVSKNSLRSAWVIIEILETLNFEKVQQKRKLLPIFIDEALFSDTFYAESLEEINNEIDKVWENTKKVRELGGGTENLDAKRTRLINLKNNLARITKTLQETLVGDFSNENKLSENLPKLINLINT